MLAAALLLANGAFAQDAKALNEEGKNALAGGNLTLALKKFQQADQADPASPQIQFNLGLVFFRMGQPAKAIAPLRKAVADPTLADQARYLLGAAYFDSGDFANARTQLGGLEESQHAEHVLFMLEESCRLTGRQAEAKQAFHALNTRFPDSGWVHYLMGNAHENQAEHEKAIAEYRAALAVDSKLPNANFAIGYIYWQDRAFEEAKPWLNRELAVQPCHALACYYLAEMARGEGETSDALRLYRRAIQCDDRNAKAHLGLGIALSQSNRNQEAIDEFRRAIRLDPRDAAAHYRLAVLYRKLGREAEAEAEYARVKQVHDASDAQAAKSLNARH